MTFKPWTFFMVAIAGWMNRQQQETIEYLRTENRILRENLGHKRIILNVAQKRR
jgi:putative transposase